MTENERASFNHSNIGDAQMNERVKQDTTSDNSQQVKPSGYSHSFDVGIARTLGVNPAIVFNHIVYWLRINKSKDANFHDDRTWMYETVVEIAEFLEYLSEKQVREAIKILVENGLIITGNYNKNKFDQTKWYALSDESILGNKKQNTIALQGKSNCPVGQMDVAPVANPNATHGNSTYIQNKNTNKKNNIAAEPPIEKKSFGSHVKLSEDEHFKLLQSLGQSLLLDLIDRVNDYCASKGKTYKDYAAAIRTFNRNKKDSPSGANHANAKDDSRKRQLDDYIKSNGDPNDCPNILKF